MAMSRFVRQTEEVLHRAAETTVPPSYLQLTEEISIEEARRRFPMKGEALAQEIEKEIKKDGLNPPDYNRARLGARRFLNSTSTPSDSSTS